MHTGNISGNRQSQATAASPSLKWLEETGLGGGIHARAVIGHLHHHPVRIAHHPNRTSLSRRLFGIIHQIKQQAKKLSAIQTQCFRALIRNRNTQPAPHLIHQHRHIGVSQRQLFWRV